MILLEQGTANTGRWRKYEVDTVRDFTESFGRKPPAVAGLAVMNDSDDTGESAVSLIDFRRSRLSRKSKLPNPLFY